MMAHETIPTLRVPVTQASRWAGITALAAAKLLDVAATLLARVPLHAEANPVAQAAIEHLGATGGLLALSALTVTVVVIAVETGASILTRVGQPWYGPVTVRVTAYGTLALLWLATGVYNLVEVTA